MAIEALFAGIKLGLFHRERLAGAKESNPPDNLKESKCPPPG
jgi:hypothetical protein